MNLVEVYTGKPACRVYGILPMYTLKTVYHTMVRRDGILLTGADGRVTPISSFEEVSIIATFDMTYHDISEYNELFEGHAFLRLECLTEDRSKTYEFILENPHVITYDTYRKYDGRVDLIVRFIASGIKVNSQ